MSTENMLLVGPRSVAAGSEVQARADNAANQAIMEGRCGSYDETVTQGTMFRAFFSTASQAGVAPGTSLSTLAAGVITNPAGSGKNISIVDAFVAFKSGTLGAGYTAFVAQGATVTAPSNYGTSITPINAKIGSTATSAATCGCSSTVTAPTQVVSVIANLAGAAPWVIPHRIVPGTIVIPPGQELQIQSVAGSGSSPLVSVEVTWEEVPV